MNPEAAKPSFDALAFAEALRIAVDLRFESMHLPLARRDKLVRFGVLLAKASMSINLTRILDPEGMTVSHFLDSSYLLPVLKKMRGPILDVGTGGGVPGIPLAIFRRDLKVVMIDGTGKKIQYVSQWIQELALKNASAFHERAEDHLKTHSYAAVVCRASVKPGAMMEMIRDVRASIKKLVFMEGSKGMEVAREILPLARRAGYSFEQARPYRLPDMRKDRFIVCFKRSRSPRSRR